MGEGAVLLRGKALPLEDELIAAVGAVTARAPFRRMAKPGGLGWNSRIIARWVGTPVPALPG